MAGYKNVVACMGSSVTGGQQSLLYSNASEVILLLDMDKAGVKGVIRTWEDMRSKIRIKPLYLPYVDTDPADYSVEDIRKIIGGYYDQKR
jgi:DNA primase